MLAANDETPAIQGSGPSNAVRSALKAARSAEYMRLSTEAAALAADSPLDNVRRKHEEAARTWLALAGGGEAAP